jgi:hypothetical protein
MENCPPHIPGLEVAIAQVVLQITVANACGPDAAQPLRRRAKKSHRAVGLMLDQLLPFIEIVKRLFKISFHRSGARNDANVHD